MATWRRVRFWMLAAGLCGCLVGCGTLNGVGRDLQTVGAWLEQSSQP